MYISTFYVLKCFAYVLLFDFCDFQILVNELVTGKVRFPPAPLNFSLAHCFLQMIFFQVYISNLQPYFD